MTARIAVSPDLAGAYAGAFAGHPLRYADGALVVGDMDQAVAQALFDAHDPMAEVRARSEAEVERLSEEARLQSRPAGAGRDVERMKEEEARAFLADPTQPLAGFPFLEDEAGRGARAAAAVAADWAAKGDAWTADAVRIERARLDARDAVAAAADPAAAQAAIDALTFPKP